MLLDFFQHASNFTIIPVIHLLLISILIERMLMLAFKNQLQFVFIGK